MASAQPCAHPCRLQPILLVHCGAGDPRRGWWRLLASAAAAGAHPAAQAQRRKRGTTGAAPRPRARQARLSQQRYHGRRTARACTATHPQVPQVEQLLHRPARSVEWVAVCPQHLEQHARMFLSEVSACYMAQGCGTHFPAARLSHVRAMGGVAVVPRDAAAAAAPAGPPQHLAAPWSSLAPTGKGPSSTAPQQPQLSSSATLGKSAGAQPLMHPVVGMVNNCAVSSPAVALDVQGSSEPGPLGGVNASQRAGGAPAVSALRSPPRCPSTPALVPAEEQ